jgi:hypothetical protein
MDDGEVLTDEAGPDAVRRPRAVAEVPAMDRLVMSKDFGDAAQPEASHRHEVGVRREEPPGGLHVVRVPRLRPRLRQIREVASDDRLIPRPHAVTLLAGTT